MMLYAKLVSDELVFAPKQFNEYGQITVGFTDKYLRDKGYKPVRYTDMLIADGSYTPHFVETEDEIIQEWIVS